jgi:hypothetical protein
VQQTTERLPFTIRIVTSAADFARAARFRSVRLEGSAVPWRTLDSPLLLGAIGLAIATALARAVRAARHPLDRTGSAGHAAPMFSHRLHSEA